MGTEDNLNLIHKGAKVISIQLFRVDPESHPQLVQATWIASPCLYLTVFSHVPHTLPSTSFSNRNGSFMERLSCKMAASFSLNQQAKKVNTGLCSFWFISGEKMCVVCKYSSYTPCTEGKRGGRWTDFWKSSIQGIGRTSWKGVLLGTSLPMSSLSYCFALIIGSRDWRYGIGGLEVRYKTL